MVDWAPILTRLLLFRMLSPDFFQGTPGQWNLATSEQMGKPFFSDTVEAKLGSAMVDWDPILTRLLLFILLSPDLFQLPGNTRTLEFGNFRTNGKATVIHTLHFFGLFTILILAVGIRIYTG
ncbi:hypothetical protein CRYUN_Cryun12cG0175800 [Craigia yunnanensis]